MIVYSELLFQLDSIHVCLNGNPDSFIAIKKKFKHIEKIKFIHTSERADWWEWPTLNYLKQNIDSDIESSYVCYTHLKGLSKSDREGLDSWREFITHWIIKQWRTCIGYLDDGYETVGRPTETVTGPNNIKCYSGNFWWAKSDYIKQLKPLPGPEVIDQRVISEYHGSEYNTVNFRNDAELWILSKVSRCKELIV
jgi:hypothetical protein